MRQGPHPLAGTRYAKATGRDASPDASQARAPAAVTLDQLSAECRAVLTREPGGIAIPVAAKPADAKEKAAKTPPEVGPAASGPSGRAGG